MMEAGLTWKLDGDGPWAKWRRLRRLVDHRGAGGGRSELTFDKRTALPRESWLCCRNLSFLWQL
ncbi:hypothetical protein E2C01_081379 [Portunus trituberculatus]|uniref:Uncharacterized protein n=1 Tax=Portunus trituberculatus TaxID=210409 RepID=A0A5B7J0Z2_PORTR|nr:hypothetical protein [Portunus trituberculatus]